MKIVQTIVIIFFVFVSKSQQQVDDSLFNSNNNIKTFNVPITYEIKSEFSGFYNKEGAQIAIKNKKMKILFSGGFGGMPDFNKQTDKEFQEKYNVNFFSQGCVRLGGNENEEEYNHTIFEFLDEKYGEVWRHEIRTDAIGFILPQEKINDDTTESYNQERNNLSQKNYFDDNPLPNYNKIWLIISIVLIIGLILLFIKIRK